MLLRLIRLQRPASRLLSKVPKPHTRAPRLEHIAGPAAAIKTVERRRNRPAGTGTCVLLPDATEATQLGLTTYLAIGAFLPAILAQAKKPEYLAWDRSSRQAQAPVAVAVIVFLVWLAILSAWSNASARWPSALQSRHNTTAT